MGRAEKRKLAKKLKHLQNTKPWEVQAIIKEEYDRMLVENRTKNKDILMPGDKVQLDLEKIMQDPDWEKMKPEYKEYAMSHANNVFTLSKQAKQVGPYGLVCFEEDETDPKWLWFLGHVKKIEVD